MTEQENVQINTGVSDLWFNHDKSNAIVKNAKGEYEGYALIELSQIADDFIVMLSLAGVDIGNLSAEVLIADFYKRL